MNEEAPRSRTWHFALVALLTLAMGYGTYVSFALGILAPFMVVELELSRAALGLLATVVYIVAAAASLVAGPLVDALGGRRMLMMVFAVTGIALVAMALAPSYLWLALATAISGVATAIINPATNQLISVHFRRGSQGVIVGVKQSGVQAALVVAGLALPATAVLIGWRGALLVSSAAALVGLLATLSLLPTATRPLRRGRRAGRPPMGSTVTRLTGYAFLMGFASAAVGTYLVLFGVEAVGLAPAAAGVASALLGLAGIVARIAWARQVERMPAASFPLAFLAVTGAASVGLIWSAQAAGDWLLWVGAIAFGSTASAWNSVGNLVLVRELPLAVAGRASGVMQVGFYGGFVVSPVVFGSLVDVTGSYDSSWTTVVVALFTACAMAWRWHLRGRRPALSDTQDAVEAPGSP